MATKYFSLVSVDHSNRVHIEFGDYKRSVVAQERTDRKDSLGWKEHTKAFVILPHSGDTQAEIQADVNDYQILVNSGDIKTHS